MLKEPVIGDLVAQPGTVQYGRWKAFTHPTGQEEFLPLILAQGREAGPCLWITAGVHGDEHAGPQVIYKLLSQALTDQMRGTLVTIPALNPRGLRKTTRHPHHGEKDPNRIWPELKPKPQPSPDQEPPSVMELTYRQLFETIVSSADALIDLHAAWTGSIPFAFRDRILYRADVEPEQNKAQAEALAEAQYELLKAFGHTIVLEMPVYQVLEEDLHRSVSGSVLYVGKIPAFTVELGTGDVPDAKIVSAAVAGIRNVMRALGMLDDPMEPIQGIPVIQPELPVRRCSTPRVKEACVVSHLVEAGDFVEKGDPIAEVCDVWGRKLGEGFLRAEYDGFVIGREHGIYYYPGEAVLCMAIPNDAPLIMPYPEGFFKIT